MRVIFTFDTYGTLIDWLGGIKNTLRRLFSLDEQEINRFISIWGMYDYELVQMEYRPYRDILSDAFRKTLNDMNIPYDQEKLDKLVYSIKEWRPFPDTKQNLLRLKDIGEIGIISNTDREFINASIRNMGVEFDHVVVAEDIKIYKPNPTVFNKAREIMEIKTEDKWFHISSYHTYDIIPAKKSGEKITTVLLDRYGYAEEAGKYSDYVYKKFSDLTSDIINLI